MVNLMKLIVTRWTATQNSEFWDAVANVCNVCNVSWSGARAAAARVLASLAPEAGGPAVLVADPSSAARGDNAMSPTA